MEDEINDYIDFAYNIVIDQTRSSYPIFTDGIKQKQDFIKHTEKCSTRNDYETLLFIYNDELEGLIQFFLIQEDKYLQLCGFNIKSKTEEGLKEFLNYIQDKYHDFDFYFGFPDTNIKAISFLKNHGFLCIEQAYNNTMVFDKYTLREDNKNIVKVSKENFNEFRKLHITDPETYWNSDRIFKNLDKWNIYLYYENNQAIGAILERNDEIFGLDYLNGVFNEETYLFLVIKILNDLKLKGTKFLTFFNDENSQALALRLGFDFVGKYVLYIREANR